MVKILEVNKVKNKYKLVTTAGEYIVFEDVLVKYTILGSKEFSDEEFKDFLKYISYTEALHVAIDYLSKPRSKKEVVDYLYKLKMYDQKVIKKLEDMGLINDSYYKDLYVDYHSRINLKGPNLIKKELAQKGIYEDFTYPNLEENIEKLTKKYLLNNKNKSSRILNQGLYNYLITKGYNPEFTNYKNDDENNIELEFEKLLKKYEKLDASSKKRKIYQALVTKGYDSYLINDYISKIE